MKTCRKPGASLHHYLGDCPRVPSAMPVPPLPHLVHQAAAPARPVSRAREFAPVIAAFMQEAEIAHFPFGQTLGFRRISQNAVAKIGRPERDKTPLLRSDNGSSRLGTLAVKRKRTPARRNPKFSKDRV